MKDKIIFMRLSRYLIFLVPLVLFNIVYAQDWYYLTVSGYKFPIYGLQIKYTAQLPSTLPDTFVVINVTVPDTIISKLQQICTQKYENTYTEYELCPAAYPIVRVDYTTAGGSQATAWLNYNSYSIQSMVNNIPRTISITLSASGVAPSSTVTIILYYPTIPYVYVGQEMYILAKWSPSCNDYYRWCRYSDDATLLQGGPYSIAIRNFTVGYYINKDLVNVSDVTNFYAVSQCLIYYDAIDWGSYPRVSIIYSLAKVSDGAIIKRDNFEICTYYGCSGYTKPSATISVSGSVGDDAWRAIQTAGTQYTLANLLKNYNRLLYVYFSQSNYPALCALLIKPPQ